MKYTCEGYRSVQSNDIYDAGLIFAEREAKKRFGPKACVRLMNTCASASNGSFAEYRAFIGKQKKDEFVGCDVFLIVHKDV